VSARTLAGILHRTHDAAATQLLLNAYRAEVRAQAAAEIRAHAAVCDDAGQRTADGILRAADLIDPNTDEQADP
jgi:hypothetical protein